MIGKFVIVRSRDQGVVCGICMQAPATTDDGQCVKCANEIIQLAGDAGLIDPDGEID